MVDFVVISSPVIIGETKTKTCWILYSEV